MIAPSPDSGSSDGITQVLAKLKAALENVRNEYSELPHREFAWHHFQQLVARRLWDVVDQPGESRYLQQLADQLEAAVTNLEALQLSTKHFAVIEATLDRLANHEISASDVAECEKSWRRVGVHTLPSFGEFLQQWIDLSRPVADEFG